MGTLINALLNDAQKWMLKKLDELAPAPHRNDPVRNVTCDDARLLADVLRRGLDYSTITELSHKDTARVEAFVAWLCLPCSVCSGKPPPATPDPVGSSPGKDGPSPK